MGRNLRKEKVEIVFNNLKKISDFCKEDKENCADKEMVLGEMCYKLKCSRRTMLDYMNTAIVHGKLKIRWKPKQEKQLKK